MRNKKKIEFLQAEIDHLYKNIDMLNNAVQYILDYIDAQEKKKEDLDSGKWYKNH